MYVYYARWNNLNVTLASIFCDKRNDIIGVPISAIVIKTDTSTVKKGKKKEKKIETDSEEKFECVFVKEGDKAKLKVIKTGIQDDTNIEIISGLEVDEEVITGPYNTVTKSLKNGDSVELKKEEKKEDKEEDS